MPPSNPDSGGADPDPVDRVRRAPPSFLPVAVQRVVPVGPRMLRVTLAGEALRGFSVELPAASVRLLVPLPGQPELVIPTWNGNEWLLPDGSRPAIRTFTPLHVDAGIGSMDLDVVVHESGTVCGWAATAQPGDLAALSGPGRGYVIDPHAAALILAGDESALPAITQLVEVAPAGLPLRIVVELTSPEARLDLSVPPGASVQWVELPAGSPPGSALLEAIGSMPIDADTQVWVAGEAAGVQRIRKQLFDEREIARRQATVRGYWKQGRSGDAGSESPTD